MFPKDRFISQFLQLINALEVARNRHLKMTGIGLHVSTGYVSKTTKYIG
jgi:hypothetical protein